MQKVIVIFILSAFALSANSLFAWDIPGLSKKTDSAEQAAKSAGDTVQSAAGISQALMGSIDKAKSAVGGGNPELASLLTNIGKQAAGGEDLSMLQSLGGLAGIPGASPLTSGQKELLAEVQGHAQALALTRNFSDDPSLAGPVSEAVKAVQSRDPVSAVNSLKAISEKGSLSPLQQNMLKLMLGDYGTYLDKAKQATDAVNSVKNLF